jgi:lipoyl synthase
MSAPVRRPEWLRKEKPLTEGVMREKAAIASSGLHTVCESARCPNLSECFRSGNATFLVMGDRCTRNCGFCAVGHGPPREPDPDEGDKIAGQLTRMSLRYAVITSVTRDDLPDGGASHFACVVRAVKAASPRTSIELLVPDFQGRAESIDLAASLPIEVLGHNLETVKSLYPAVRKGADYIRSLEVLRRAGAAGAPRIKTGIMVGLGETTEELSALFDDCAAAGVSILTIGQYLRPGWRNVPVARYVDPEEFERLAILARGHGVPFVHAGPYVRSSYLAESLCRKKI